MSMTKKELVIALQDFNDDEIVIICDGNGDYNDIEEVGVINDKTAIFCEASPIGGE